MKGVSLSMHTERDVFFIKTYIKGLGQTIPNKTFLQVLLGGYHQTFKGKNLVQPV